jgi:hypothetical protein
MTPLRQAALEALKHLSGGSIDPIEVIPIAERIERASNVGSFELHDVYAALDSALDDGLVRYVEIGRYSAFAMTEKGFEEV